MTLQEIEARLRREPELDKLEANVVQALARAVMWFVQADEAATEGGDPEGESSRSPPSTTGGSSGNTRL